MFLKFGLKNGHDSPCSTSQKHELQWIALPWGLAATLLKEERLSSLSWADLPACSVWCRYVPWSPEVFLKFRAVCTTRLHTISASVELPRTFQRRQQSLTSQPHWVRWMLVVSGSKVNMLGTSSPAKRHEHESLQKQLSGWTRANQSTSSKILKWTETQGITKYSVFSFSNSNFTQKGINSLPGMSMQFMIASFLSDVKSFLPVRLHTCTIVLSVLFPPYI